jgi:hypothetical protein
VVNTTLAENAKHVVPAPAAFTFGDSGFVGEDIAYDARRDRFLISGVLGRRVVARAPSGGEKDFITEKTAGPLWAVMALGIDSARDVLWLTTVADDRVPGLPTGARPRASVLRVKLDDGTVERRFEFPDDGVPHEPGDLGMAANGDVFISDGRQGAVYVIRRQRDSLETLLPPGTLNSPQEPAASPDGQLLAVPDYLGGIALVPLNSGRAQTQMPSWVRHARNIVVNGIDGLKWTAPYTLIAVQNGVTPNRLLRLTLDSTYTEVVRSDLLAQGPDLPDPTHGIIVGNDYVVIARAGWYALDDSGHPRPGEKLLPPLIARIRLTR